MFRTLRFRFGVFLIETRSECIEVIDDGQHISGADESVGIDVVIIAVGALQWKPPGAVSVEVVYRGLAGDGATLWRSDGTADGTREVPRDTVSTNSGFPRLPTTVGDVGYFVATDGLGGDQLWKTDGTASGTVLVKAVRNADYLTNVNGKLFFRAYSTD